MSNPNHPLHPATVHYPFAFLTVSYTLDLVSGLAIHPSTTKLLNAVYNFTPVVGDIARFSHYASIIGLITALPSLSTGVMELLSMIQKQDIATKFEKSQNKAQTVSKFHPKIKLALIHAATMDLCVFASAYNWWTRRSATDQPLEGLNLLLSAGALVFMSVSGFLGGMMVYDHGVGVRRGRSEPKSSKEQ